MQIGSAKAFRGLAIFVALMVVGLVLKRGGMPDFFGVLWWVLVIGGSLYFVWAGSTGRLGNPTGGWGTVTPPKIWRWLLGEDDAERMATRDDREQREQRK